MSVHDQLRRCAHVVVLASVGQRVTHWNRARPFVTLGWLRVPSRDQAPRRPAFGPSQSCRECGAVEKVMECVSWTLTKFLLFDFTSK